MKTYRGTIVFRYYQELTVEAETPDDAERIMAVLFDQSKADGDCDIYDLEEVKNESSI
jgi:hypothetical protein